jgi:hypothetical protein
MLIRRERAEEFRTHHGQSTKHVRLKRQYERQTEVSKLGIHGCKGHPVLRGYVNQLMHNMACTGFTQKLKGAFIEQIESLADSVVPNQAAIYVDETRHGVVVCCGFILTYF